MAKNLFDQLLSKASEIWSGTQTRNTQDIYVKDSSGLSGVAKYLAKHEEAANPKESEKTAAGLSGVEKYLAKQQAAAKETIQQTPATGVAKYLARQATGTAAPAPAKEPVIIPKTGVGKYLAGMPLAHAATKPAPASTEKKPPVQTKTEAKKAPAAAKKPAPVAAVKEAAVKTDKPAAEAPAVPAATGDVIHFENVTQCQSRTVKGTQCKNTNHLTKLQRTINKKKYTFSACPQHHNDTFKPYPPLLESN